MQTQYIFMAAGPASDDKAQFLSGNVYLNAEIIILQIIRSFITTTFDIIYENYYYYHYYYYYYYY